MYLLNCTFGIAGETVDALEEEEEEEEEEAELRLLSSSRRLRPSWVSWGFISQVERKPQKLFCLFAEV